MTCAKHSTDRHDADSIEPGVADAASVAAFERGQSFLELELHRRAESAV